MIIISINFASIIKICFVGNKNKKNYESSILLSVKVNSKTAFYGQTKLILDINEYDMNETNLFKILNIIDRRI